MAAHVAEHLAFAYRDRVEKELGVEIPNGPQPEDIELRLSRLVAPASAQVTGKAQKMAQAEENAEKSKDPIIQQKERETDIKADKVQKDAATKMAAIDADRQKSSERAQLERDRLALDRANAMSKENIEAIKLALDYLTRQQQNQQDVELRGFETGIELMKDIVDDGKRNNSQ